MRIFKTSTTWREDWLAELGMALVLGLLSISPMFLALDYSRFFSAHANLDLFVNPFFPIYVLIVAASLSLVLLVPRKKHFGLELFFLGAVMILMSTYATFLSTSTRFASPFVLLAVTEPLHVATAKDILVHGHLAIENVFYHGWPLPFLLLAMFSSVLGSTVAGIPYVNFLLSTALQSLMLLSLYLLGDRFYGQGVITVFLYYVAAFYFFSGGGGTLGGFSPQLFAFPFIVLYVILMHKGMKQPDSAGINALLLLFTFAIVFSNLTSAVFLICFVSSAFLVQRLAHSNIFGALAGKISIVYIAVLAWLIYFASFDFGQIFAASTGGGFWSFLAEYVLSSAIGSGNPYLAVNVWYVALLKLYRTWITLLAMLAGILGFLLSVRTEKRSGLRHLAMAIGFSFAAFAVFFMVFLRVFENFWERIFDLGYPFLLLFSLTTLRTLRSHMPQSLHPFFGKRALGFAVIALIVTSFLASNVSLTMGYSSSEFSTATFLSRHYSDRVLGMSHQFYQVLKYADIEKPYLFDETMFRSDYDIKFFVARLSEHPTLYDAGMVVRTNREVAFFYAAFGILYDGFWGKIDHSLAAEPGFERVFDSGTERIYSQ